MALLRFLWVIHTTAKTDDAQTNARFRLVLRDPASPGRMLEEPFPELGHNQRERDRTDEYFFDMRKPEFRVEMSDVLPEHLGMKTLGGNAWLPRSIWMIGQDDDDARRLLVAQPTWSKDGWFSIDTSDAGGKARPTRFMNFE
jgi:hypothetical protein